MVDGPYLPAWRFLATSRSRRGEVLGPKWDDIVLDAALAIVSRRITTVDHRIDDGWIFCRPGGTPHYP